MLTATAADKDKPLDPSLEFLAEAAIEFAEAGPDKTIFDTIGRRLKNHLGDCIVSVNVFHPDSQQVEVQSLFGLDQHAGAVAGLLGGKPVGRLFTIDDSAKTDLLSGLLHQLPQGIFDLSPTIAEDVCRELETLLGIGAIYSMGFTRKGRLFGNVVIMLPRGQDLANAKLVETYINLASVAIERHGIQEQLQGALDDMGKRVGKRTAQLLESEQRYRFLAENMADIVWTIDTDFKATYVSPSIEKILGFTPEERKRQPLEQMVAPDSLHAIQAVFLEQMQIEARGKADPDRAVVVEVEYYRKDGSTAWFENTVKAIRDKSGAFAGMYGVSRDISERKQAERQHAELERQVRQSQKAESLSRMAGAIAHHFNNQLGVVLGNLEMAIAELPDEQKTRRHLLCAFQATRQATEISALMLAYLGQGSGACERIDIAAMLRQNLPLLPPAIQEGIALETDLPPSGPLANANAKQLWQVVAHLITNACEAIGADAGTIRLATGTIPAAAICMTNLSPSHWTPTTERFACITVEDTGGGMAEEDMERLFDPFFSTKLTGRGLGLAVALGLVKSWGGAIGVESKQKQGSIFRVYLPLAAEDRAAEGTNADGPAETSRKGVVLLVEDHDMVRELAEDMLGRLGFAVIAVADGEQAIQRFADQPDRICCVIADLSMPGINGWQTLAAMRQTRADIPTILVSGYDEAQARKTVRADQPQEFLKKPYSLVQLEAALNRVLDK